MGSTFKVGIKPEILQFAIKRSGYSKEELVNKINRRFKVKYFDKDYLINILNGRIKPRYTDLKKIDTYIKRGIPFYFLEELPDEKIFVNFRKKHRDYKLSPKIEIKLRKYEYLREEINLLLKDENISHKRTFPLYTIKDDPLKTALEIREKFKIENIKMISLSSKDVFEYIRRNIENHLIFVFKDSIGILRGCVFLNDNFPPLILINSNDDKNAEIFSLLHEFGHYLLNNEGIDIEDKDLKYDKYVEFWCNDFAYHFLMKKENEIKEGFTKKNKSTLLSPLKLTELSKKYKLSKHAFVYRFLKTGIINSKEYNEFLNAFPYKQKAAKSDGGNYYYTNRDRLSREFISIVYNNYLDGNISLYKTYNYLGVRDNDHINQLLEVLYFE